MKEGVVGGLESVAEDLKSEQAKVLVPRRDELPLPAPTQTARPVTMNAREINSRATPADGPVEKAASPPRHPELPSVRWATRGPAGVPRSSPWYRSAAGGHTTG